tara:strand:- start:398 stop:880 length:483 start_codon:yes stop_codon:yes gene_type:complete
MAEKDNIMKIKNMAYWKAKNSPLKQSGASDFIGDMAKKEAIKKGATGILGRTAGKIVAPIGIGSSLYGMYKSGQEHSGGKYGYEPNPNYDPTTGEGMHSEDAYTDKGEFGGTAQWRRRKPMGYDSWSDERKYGEKDIPTYSLSEEDKKKGDFSGKWSLPE